MKKLFLVLILLPSISIAQEFLDVTPDHQVKFPRDFYFKKDYRVQWWYFTGHLLDENKREFGYELTFFVVSVQKRNYKSQFGVNTIYISHFAISDIAGERFYFNDRADAGAYGFAGAREDQLNVWVGKNSLKGNMNEMRLKASDDKNMIDLKLIPAKPIILHGENGYSRKSEESPLISSIYFSYVNMKTEGILKIGNQTFNVKGKSWFDREISSRSLSENQEGWDWFAIQLDDGREIMLYIIRNKDGFLDEYSSGTFVYPNGKYRKLSRGDFNVKVLSYYYSKKTKAKYPSEWEIKIYSEDIVLKITPLLEDQEIIAYGTTGNYYWEGSCKVEGTSKGRAYVEMTGY